MSSHLLVSVPTGAAPGASRSPACPAHPRPPRRRANVTAERIAREIDPCAAEGATLHRTLLDAATVLLPALGEEQARIVLAAIVHAVRAEREDAEL